MLQESEEGYEQISCKPKEAVQIKSFREKKMYIYYQNLIVSGIYQAFRQELFDILEPLCQVSNFPQKYENLLAILRETDFESFRHKTGAEKNKQIARLIDGLNLIKTDVDSLIERNNQSMDYNTKTERKRMVFGTPSQYNDYLKTDFEQVGQTIALLNEVKCKIPSM